MTKQEITERFQIPWAVIEEYESWNFCETMGEADVRQYDDRDVECLSLMMTLHEIGFAHEERKHYMKLYLSKNDTSAERLNMLNQQRLKSLDELHLREIQLDQLDVLRYELKNRRNRKGDSE
ncbi:hypothetical protein CLOSTMETH_02523 [[Clostridium] methylpentosum DSM 5476]|uniref:HTH merR-type domain-containing protein n=1 Tax=[Clostridium] methylpentosum DSM 5476 TaxID=537013 RepID=C0EF82_9FIRM|nr:hypothetical protein CLOSTMETH_02523 [[Clostridium] methylpentosum DSM 5476]MDY3987860.1 MerR family transcriptional regulator [Massilioclostridium sp.]MEE1490689.1 MerR family transcriptional regulator [Massilioclostridium sp.]